MTVAYPVTSVYPVITDIDGQPLEGGYVWIGQPDLDPQTNPIQVYWDKELTITAPQPIRTIGGYFARSGSPANVYAATDFSMRVMNKNGTVIYSAPKGSIAALEELAMTQLRADLSSTAGGKGAALVGFKQAGVGAVNRTALDKLLENLSPEDFGAVGDGTTDDTAALIAFGLAGPAHKTITTGKRYKITQMISFKPGDLVDGKGIIDASSATSWPYPAVVKVAGFLTQVANLAANATIGSDSVNLASTAGITAGNALIIYNPTVKSWAGWRDEYKAGEFVRVHSVSGSEVRLMGSLYDSYTTAAVNVYRLDGAPTTFRDFAVLAPSLEVVGVQMSCIDRPVMENVWSIGALGASMEFERCMDIRFDGVAYQTQTPTGDEYGLAIANCHGGAVTAPSLYGGRHALAIGGYPYVGSVTNRAITVQVGAMGNRAPTGAQDMHGNCEDLRFIGGTFQNGGIVAGKNHKFIGCRMVGKLNSGISLYAGELVGGAFEFTNCTFESLVNPNALGYGIVELSNLTTSNTGKCKFVFNNCQYKAPSATVYGIKVVVSGTTFSPEIIVNGADLECSGMTQFLRLARDSGVATISRVAITSIYGLPSGAEYVVNAGTGLSVTQYTLPMQYGTVNVAGVTSSNNATATVTFNHPYPVAPTINTFKPQGTTLGGLAFVPNANSASSTGFQIVATSLSGANYSNTITGVVGWQSILDQH